MNKGFDVGFSVEKFAAELKGKYDFVVRYYNVNNPSKNLTLKEARAFVSAGIRLAAVWENGYPTTAGYFNPGVGQTDGQGAFAYANTKIGQPFGTPIYFAVDYDATLPQITNLIIPYFREIQDAFGQLAAPDGKTYKVGVYGSGQVCAAIAKAQLADFSWMAQASDWAGYSTFKSYNIKQTGGITVTTAIGKFKCDGDTSPNDNEGSFTINIASKPATVV